MYTFAKIFTKNINFSLTAICGNPPLIERASVIANSTAEGGVAIYTCFSGTVTEGSTSIVCQNDGFWSHTNLYCRRKTLWLPSRIVISMKFNNIAYTSNMLRFKPYMFFNSKLWPTPGYSKIDRQTRRYSRGELQVLCLWQVHPNWRNHRNQVLEKRDLVKNRHVLQT